MPATKQLNQNEAPIYQALQNFQKMRVVPFDVPGHKRGRGNPELAAGAVTVTTLLSAGTLFCWVFLFKVLGMF